METRTGQTSRAKYQHYKRLLWVFNRIFRREEIESNRLKIANLEDQIYGSTEVNSREKQEITQQKTLHNVWAKNSTRNNPMNQR